MGVTIATTRVAANTSTGNQTITTDDLGGLTPKAVLLVATRGVTDGTAADGSGFYVGFSDGTTHLSEGYEDEHGQTDVDKSYLDSTDILTIYDGAADDVVDGAASFSSFTTNGVTINWSNAPASAFLIQATFFAGTDLTVDVGSVNLGNTSSATIPITSIGFEADAVLTFLLQGTSSFLGAVGMGFIHNDRAGTVTQRAIGYQSRQGWSSGYQLSQVWSAKCIARFAENGIVEFDGAAQSFDSSGFDVQIGSRPPGNTHMGWIALRFGSTPVVNSKVYTYSTPTSTGSQTDSNPGFTPQAVFYLATRCAAVDTDESDADAGPFGFLVADADEVYTQTIASQDGSADTNTQSLSDDGLILPQHDGSMTQAHQATLTSLGATGPVWNYSSTDTSQARQWAGLAIQAETAGATVNLAAVISGTTTTSNISSLAIGRNLAATIAHQTSTTDTASAGIARNLAAVLAWQTATNDNATLSIAGIVNLAATIAWQSATSDTASIAIARNLAAALAWQTSTPDDASVTVGRNLVATLAWQSATNDSAILSITGIVELAATISMISSTNDAAILAVARNLAAILTGQTATTDTASVGIARNLAAALSWQTTTNDSATLTVTVGILLAAIIAGQTSTNDAASLGIGRNLAAVSGWQTSTNDAALLAVARNLVASINWATVTPDDATLITAAIAGIISVAWSGRRPGATITGRRPGISFEE